MNSINGDKSIMIDIGKLYCGGTSTGDGLRYGTKAGPDSNKDMQPEMHSLLY
jgi:hypothetical protein